MVEESFGIIPLRKSDAEWDVFLVQHIDGHWGFPKGRAEKGELPYQAAARELKEETNLEIVTRLVEDPCIERYEFTRKGEQIFKQVTYFICEVAGDIHLQQIEVKQGLWVSPEQAFVHLTYPQGKAVLKEVMQRL